jgi:hypothetical protein
MTTSRKQVRVKMADVPRYEYDEQGRLIGTTDSTTADLFYPGYLFSPIIPGIELGRSLARHFRRSSTATSPRSAPAERGLLDTARDNIISSFTGLSVDQINTLRDVLGSLDPNQVRQLQGLIGSIDPQKARQLIEALNSLDPAKIKQLQQVISSLNPEQIQQLQQIMTHMGRVDPKGLATVLGGISRVGSWWNSIPPIKEWPAKIWELIKANPVSAAGIGIGLLWLLRNLFFSDREDRRGWSEWLVPLGLLVGLPLLEQYVVKPFYQNQAQATPPQPTGTHNK